MATEILFYHLEQSPLEKVLPALLGKSLERGWRAAVELGDAARIKPLDEVLWSFDDESFLPHGAAGGDHDADQPILLTADDTNPNGAHIRFFVEGAVPRDGETYQRLVFMFDGHNPDAVATARTAWKTLRENNDITYWQQEPSGKWTKKG